MATATTSTISLPINNFYVRNMLQAAQPADVHGRYLQMVDLPAGEGTQTVKWRRYSNITNTTTALTEGVTPPSSSQTVTDISATTSQYGTYIPLTDQVNLLSVEKPLVQIGEKLGQQAGHTADVTRRDVLIAGANAYYSGGTTTATVDEGLTGSLLKKAIRALKRTNTTKITGGYSGTTSVGTTPIRAGFVGIIHPDTSTSLEAVSGFVPVIEYPRQDAMPDEVGAFKEIRFFESTNAEIEEDAGAAIGATGFITTTGTLIDVYKTLIFGADYAGGVALAGHAMKKYIVPPGEATIGDPLAQKGTVGWKGQWVTKILNDDFGIRIEHGNLDTPA